MALFTDLDPRFQILAVKFQTGHYLVAEIAEFHARSFRARRAGSFRVLGGGRGIQAGDKTPLIPSLRIESPRFISSLHRQ
jgi:hypothetical protein